LTAFRDDRKALSVFAIPIANQETRTLTKGGRFSKLLCDPRFGWMSGDIKMNAPPGTQLNNEEEIRLVEEQVDNRQEITVPNIFGMVLEKNRPSLARGRVWTGLITLFKCGSRLKPQTCPQKCNQSLTDPTLITGNELPRRKRTGYRPLKQLELLCM
jgi:hypothetical protein